MLKGSPFSTSSSTLVISSCFDNSCSDRYEVISHCGFDLHFPDDEWCWASFHVPVGHLCVFFGRMSTQILCPSLIGLVFFVVVTIELYELLCILDIPFINPFCKFWILTYWMEEKYWFMNIFFHSVGCLFILLMVFFALQKLLSLIWSIWVFLPLLPLPLESDLKKNITKSDVKELTIYVFS